MEIKAVLFDVYGTIIDIETDEGKFDVYQAIAHFLEYRGISVAPLELRDLYFQTMLQLRDADQQPHGEVNILALWRDLLRQLGFPPAKLRPNNSLFQFLAEMHRTLSRKRLRLSPGITELLKELKTGFRLGIVTDGHRPYVLPELAHFHLLDYFDSIVISEDSGVKKPEPLLLNKALLELEVTPENAVFVGNDMYRDIFGAQQSGLKAIFYPTEFGAKSHPGTVPDYIVNTLAEVPAAIDFLKQQ